MELDNVLKSSERMWLNSLHLALIRTYYIRIMYKPYLNKIIMYNNVKIISCYNRSSALEFTFEVFSYGNIIIFFKLFSFFFFFAKIFYVLWTEFSLYSINVIQVILEKNGLLPKYFFGFIQF